ncbi:hypothetical protein PG989_000511 [Apiospora arundinis]
MANRYSTRVYAVHVTVRDQARLMHRMHLFDRKSFCLGTFGALLLSRFLASSPPGGGTSLGKEEFPADGSSKAVASGTKAFSDDEALRQVLSHRRISVTSTTRAIAIAAAAVAPTARAHDSANMPLLSCINRTVASFGCKESPAPPAPPAPRNACTALPLPLPPLEVMSKDYARAARSQPHFRGLQEVVVTIPPRAAAIPTGAVARPRVPGKSNQTRPSLAVKNVARTRVQFPEGWSG